MKKILTLDDTARCVSSISEEPVSVADILQLVLDRSLTLSVRFLSPVVARPAEILAPNVDELLYFFTKSREVPSDPEGTLHQLIAEHFRRTGDSNLEKRDEILAFCQNTIRAFEPIVDSWRENGVVNNCLAKGESFKIENRLCDLRGVYDLPLIGGEMLNVEAALDALMGGHGNAPKCFDGYFVRDPENETIYQIQQREAGDDGSVIYRAANTLSLERYFVVRQESIVGFMQAQRDSISVPEKQKELDPRAETTYLNIVGALLALLLDKTPAGKPHSVFRDQSAIIVALLARHPATRGISQRSLEGKFADAKRSLAAT